MRASVAKLQPDTTTADHIEFVAINLNELPIVLLSVGHEGMVTFGIIAPNNYF